MAGRPRPRGIPVKDDDAHEERTMWNEFLGHMKKLKEVHSRAAEVSKLIVEVEEKMSAHPAPAVREIDALQELYREGLKLAEEEQTILNDDPKGTVQKLHLLTALRNASQNEPRTSTNFKSRNNKRKLDMDGGADSPVPSPSAASSTGYPRLKGFSGRSGSVPFMARDTKESLVKTEDASGNGVDGGKGTAAEKAGLLVKNAEVAFKQKGPEGDWIQCIIISVSGEGKNKRYEVQDPEPDEHGAPGQIYRTTAASLVPIPPPGSALPDYPKGKQVLARYPDTTTFYRAEVMGMKRDTCRLKFEGEEEIGKEMDVDRRYVLDYGGRER